MNGLRKRKKLSAVQLVTFTHAAPTSLLILLTHVIVHEPRPEKMIFVAPPTGHSEFGIKLKLVACILQIYLLPIM